MSKIKKVEKELEDLERLYWAKKHELQKLRFTNEDFIEMLAFYVVEGVVEGKSVSFERGCSGFGLSFETFIHHAAIVETLNGGGQTHLDLMLDKYSKMFKLTELEKQKLIEKYWHSKNTTMKEIFLKKFEHYLKPLEK